jgi:hypothetical protein
MIGILYILSNPSMSGVLKIGQTSKLLKERVSALSNVTGIPTGFVIETFFEVAQPQTVEKQIHFLLQRCRVRNQREFFRLSTAEAIGIIQPFCCTPPTKLAGNGGLRAKDERVERWTVRREFMAIVKELWDLRKAELQSEFLNVPTPRSGFFDIKHRRWLCAQHNLEAYLANEQCLKDATQIVRDLGGSLALTSGGLILAARPHSISTVDILSALDLRSERIAKIVRELQEAERGTYLVAKETYERRSESRWLSVRNDNYTDSLE